MLSLASTSAIRQSILRAAGIPFEIVAARVDERGIQDALVADGANPRDIVDALAEYKARKGSSKTGGWVLGCDQIMLFQDRIYGKPENPDVLRDLMTELSGETHQLLTANVLYQDGKPVWRHVGRVDLTMRDLTDEEIKAHVNDHWDQVQHAAGGYYVENTPHLFETIKGDWFDILGLSITPLIRLLNLHGHATDAQRPKLSGVLGYPIKQSKSPVLHGHWLNRYNAHGMYTAIEVPPGQFDRTIGLLRGAGFSGCNVTLPHKEATLKISDHQSPAATSIGASNTLFFRKEGIYADNTDAFGFMENIRGVLPGWSADGNKALVLGAGGAARAVIWALLDDGADQVFLTNRTQEKAEQLAKEFGDRVTVLSWSERSDRNSEIDFMVNTTSLGMVGQPPLDFDVSGLRSKAVVTDIVYKPIQTDLLTAAAKLGCPTVDGLGMLLYQAVPGFEGWFGPTPQVDDELRRAVLA